MKEKRVGDELILWEITDRHGAKLLSIAPVGSYDHSELTLAHARQLRRICDQWIRSQEKTQRPRGKKRVTKKQGEK